MNARRGRTGKGRRGLVSWVWAFGHTSAQQAGIAFIFRSQRQILCVRVADWCRVRERRLHPRWPMPSGGTSVNAPRASHGRHAWQRQRTKRFVQVDDAPSERSLRKPAQPLRPAAPFQQDLSGGASEVWLSCCRGRFRSVHGRLLAGSVSQPGCRPLHLFWSKPIQLRATR